MPKRYVYVLSEVGLGEVEEASAVRGVFSDLADAIVAGAVMAADYLRAGGKEHVWISFATADGAYTVPVMSKTKSAFAASAEAAANKVKSVSARYSAKQDWAVVYWDITIGGLKGHPEKDPLFAIIQRHRLE